MSAEVRPATAADAALLVRLNRSVQVVHAAKHPEEFRQTVDPGEAMRFFAGVLAQPVNIVGIAELDGEIAGYIWCELQRRSPTPFTVARSRLYVHHVSVDAWCRRKGVGAALLAYASERAAGEGVTEIALDTWSRNTAAQAFFAAQGFETFRLLLRKQV